MNLLIDLVPNTVNIDGEEYKINSDFRYSILFELLMQDKNATFIFTSGIDDTRYVSGTELFKIAQNFKTNQELIIKNLDEAIKYVMENCKNCVTFFVGSFYTYSFVTESIRNYRLSNN